MAVVDSSAWIEYFTNAPRAKQFAEVIRKAQQVITPTLVLFEVYKKLKKELSENDALIAAAEMEQTFLAPLSPSTAYLAADLSIEYRLGMADAIIYATARSYDAHLITLDVDFKGLPGVSYFA